MRRSRSFPTLILATFATLAITMTAPAGAITSPADSFQVPLDTGVPDWYESLDCTTYSPSKGVPKTCDGFTGWDDLDTGVQYDDFYHEHYCTNGDSNVSVSPSGRGEWRDRRDGVGDEDPDRCDPANGVNPEGTSISDHRDDVHVHVVLYGPPEGRSSIHYLTYDQAVESGDLSSYCTIDPSNPQGTFCDPQVLSLPTVGTTTIVTAPGSVGYTFIPPSSFTTATTLTWYARNGLHYTWVSRVDPDGTHTTSEDDHYSTTASATYSLTFAPAAPDVSCSAVLSNAATTPSVASFHSAYLPGSGDIKDWSWDFGDGTTGSGANATHTYTNSTARAVSYTSVLTVSNGTGTSQCTVPVTVNPSPAVAAFAYSATNSQRATTTVAFTDASTGPADSWSWNFGDGTSASTIDSTHTYTTPGVYLVSHSVTNSAGTSTYTAPLKVWQPLPVAAFTIGADNQLHAPSISTMTNTSSCPGCTFVSWDFGDGTTISSSASPTTSSVWSPSHAYTKPGTYTVVLSVTNESGTSTASTTVVVLNPWAPYVSISCTPSAGVVPVTVTCTAEANDQYDVLPPILSWSMIGPASATVPAQTMTLKPGSLPALFFASTSFQLSMSGTYQVRAVAVGGALSATSNVVTITPTKPSPA